MAFPKSRLGEDALHVHAKMDCVLDQFHRASLAASIFGSEKRLWGPFTSARIEAIRRAGGAARLPPPGFCLVSATERLMSGGRNSPNRIPDVIGDQQVPGLVDGQSDRPAP